MRKESDYSEDSSSLKEMIQGYYFDELIVFSWWINTEEDFQVRKQVHKGWKHVEPSQMHKLSWTDVRTRA